MHTNQQPRLLVGSGEFMDGGGCGRVDAVGGGWALDGGDDGLGMGTSILEGRRRRAVVEDMRMGGVLKAALTGVSHRHGSERVAPAWQTAVYIRLARMNQSDDQRREDRHVAARCRSESRLSKSRYG